MRFPIAWNDFMQAKWQKKKKSLLFCSSERHVRIVAHSLVKNVSQSVLCRQRKERSLIFWDNIIQNESADFTSPHNRRNHLGRVSSKGSEGKWHHFEAVVYERCVAERTCTAQFAGSRTKITSSGGSQYGHLRAHPSETAAFTLAQRNHFN